MYGKLLDYFYKGQTQLGKVKVGSAWPLGSSVTLDGVNFSIAAPHATNVELLIFQNEDDEYAKETISLDHKNRSGDYWHVEIEGLAEGTLYGYKVSIHIKFLRLDPLFQRANNLQTYFSDLRILFLLHTRHLHSGRLIILNLLHVVLR